MATTITNIQNEVAAPQFNKQNLLQEMNDLREQAFVSVGTHIEPLTEEFADSVRELADDICKEASLTLNVAPLSEECQQSFCSMVEKLSAQIESRIKQIGNSVNPFGMAVKVAMVLIGGYAFYVFLKNGSTYLYEGFRTISLFFKNSNEYENQDGDKWGKFTSFVATCCSLVGVKMSLNSVSKFVTNFKKNSENLHSFVDFIKSYVHSFINFVRIHLLNMEGLNFDSNCESVITDWILEIRGWQIKETQGTMIMNGATYEILLALKVTGRRIQSMFDTSLQHYDNLRATIRVAHNELDKLIEAFKRTSVGKAHVRPKPLTIVLKGKSGVGKSAMTLPFLNAVLARTMKSEEELKRFEENSDDFIYSRACETGFWDGYIGQKAVVYDDFLQANDTKPMGNTLMESFEIIRIVNMFPTVLHKAHLEDKGNSYFEGRIVLCSTNRFDLKTTVIAETEALKRRFDVVVEVYPRVEFCVPGTEAGEFHQRRLKPMDVFSTDVYEFHLHRWNDDINFTVLSFEQLVDVSVEKYWALDQWDLEFKKTVGEMKEYDVLVRRSELRSDVNYNLSQNLEFKDCLSTTEELNCENLVEQSYDDYFIEKQVEKKFFARKQALTQLKAMSEHTGWFDKAKEIEAKLKELDVHGKEDLRKELLAVIEETMRTESLSISEALEKEKEKEKASRSRLNRVLERTAYLIKEIKCIFLGLWAHIQKIWDEHPILYMLFNASLAFTVMKLVGYFSKDKPLVEQSSSSINPVIRKDKPKRAMRVSNDLMYFAQNGPGNVQVIQQEKSILRRNLYVVMDGDGEKMGFSLALKDKFFSMNAHYNKIFTTHSMIDKTEKISFVPLPSWVNKNTDGQFTVSVKDLAKYKPTDYMLERDFWIFPIDGNIRRHQNILDKFVTHDHLMEYERILPYRFTFCHDADGVLSINSGRSPLIMIAENGVKKIDKTICYGVQTKVGDCGSLVFLDDKSRHGNILGIHCLGNGDHGVATVVTREDLQEMMGSNFKPNELTVCALGRDCVGGGYHEQSKSKWSIKDKVDEINEVFIEPWWYESEEFNDPTYATVSERMMDTVYAGASVYGTLSKPVFITRKSKLRKSVLHDCFGDKVIELKEPAVLTPVGDIDPYTLTVARYQTPDHFIDSVELQMAVQNYSYLLNRVVKGSFSKRIMGFEESCAGIHGNPYFNGIPRKTSPGFPWTQLVSKPGKKEYFGEDGEYEFTSEACVALKEHTLQVIEKAKKGIRCLHLFTDTLKDELRSKKKVENLSTRMISGAPVDYVIACRMYFGSFVEAMMQNKVINGSAIGINPFCGQWDFMAKYLLEKGDNMIAGDFSGFDSTQSSQILRAILTIINRWYCGSKEEELVRETLWRDLYSSRHIHHNMILQWKHCLPSGHPLTSIVNTIYVNILVRLCFMKCMGNPGHLINFEELVRVVAFGDDHIISVDDTILEKFNYKTISREMSGFGMVYTDENKNSMENMPISKPLTECTFLKRHFHLFENGRYKAPLDLQTVIQICYWYTDGPNPSQRQLENCENCLRELAIYDDEVFDTFQTQMLAKLYSLDDRPFDQPSYPRQMYACAYVLSNQMNPIYAGACFDCCEQWEEDIDQEMTFSNFVSHDKPLNNRGWVEQAGGNIEQQIIGESSTAPKTTNELTEFLDDSETRQNQPFPVVNLSVGGVFDLGEAARRDGVKDFLKTPVLIRQFYVMGTNVSNDTISTIVLPFDSSNKGFNTASGQGMWEQRLTAYYGFRGTAVLRFQVNCNRFAQGRLLVHYIPGQLADTDDAKVHRFNLQTKSQNPRTEINLNRDTNSILRVPYVSANGAYDLSGTVMNERTGKMGNVYVVVYSPLLGANEIQINAFLHFEDVELLTPTYYPQANTRYMFQNAGEQEEKTGPISAPLNVLSKAVGLVGRIPSLSSIAQPASWFLKASAMAAQAFGYSKPSNQSNNLKVTMMPNAYQLTCDGNDVAYPMGFSCMNKIESLPGFAGNDVDEMSLEYVCNRPAYVSRVTWSSSDVIIQKLTQGLGPRIYETPTTIGGEVVYTMTPFSFVARHFAFWRADIVFTIKVVKTEFHTGKLLLTYRPGDSLGSGYNGLDEMNYAPREILDMKESDTFVVTFPYAELTPYIPVTQSMGYVQISILTPLNAPDSVSDSVDIILEVSAKNVQFAGPSDSIMTVATGSTAAFTPQAFSKYHWQSRDMRGEAEDQPREKAVSVGGMTVKGVNLNNPRYCVGEEITSFKQIMMRKAVLRGLDTVTSIQSIAFQAFVLGGCYYDGINWSNHPLSGDPLSTISCCYTLIRGGLRYTLNMISSNNNMGASFVLSPQDQITAPQDFVLNAARYLYPWSFVNQQVAASGNGVSIEIPQLSYTHSRESAVAHYNTSRAPVLGAPAGAVMFSGQGNWPNANGAVLQRAAADDYQLGFFIGVPSLRIATGTRIY